jgi:hypothetical protein
MMQTIRAYQIAATYQRLFLPFLPHPLIKLCRLDEFNFHQTFLSLQLKHQTIGGVEIKVETKTTARDGIT